MHVTNNPTSNRRRKANGEVRKGSEVGGAQHIERLVGSKVHNAQPTCSSHSSSSATLPQPAGQWHTPLCIVGHHLPHHNLAPPSLLQAHTQACLSCTTRTHTHAHRHTGTQAHRYTGTQVTGTQVTGTQGTQDARTCVSAVSRCSTRVGATNICAPRSPATKMSPTLSRSMPVPRHAPVRTQRRHGTHQVQPKGSEVGIWLGGSSTQQAALSTSAAGRQAGWQAGRQVGTRLHTPRALQHNSNQAMDPPSWPALTHPRSLGEWLGRT
jgi:hypothetical protein